MITKLLNEVNENIEALNNLVQDKEYFKKLDERIEKINNHCLDLEKENKNLKQKYNIMKENAETLANRIDRAINYIEKNNYVDTDIVLDILQYGRFEEGEDKE